MIRIRDVCSNFCFNLITLAFNEVVSLILIFNSYELQLGVNFLQENNF